HRELRSRRHRPRANVLGSVPRPQAGIVSRHRRSRRALIMAKAKPHAPDDKVALYEKLVATNPGVERKDAANPYTSHKGRMFSMLGKGGVMILRLPDGEREAFVKKYKTKLAVQYGTTMPEFVE